MAETPIESPQFDTESIIQQALESAPTKEAGERLKKLLEGEFDTNSYDCARTALYVFGFIDNPSDEIPFWVETEKRLTELEKPEPWAIARYQEQIFSHTTVVLATEPIIILLSKHGRYHEPTIETQDEVMEYYPEKPLYFRVNY